MFYGVLDEGFFNKNKNSNSNNSNLNTDSDRENMKSQMEKFKQLNDKYKSAIKPREY